MKLWITAFGICFALLVGCSKGEIQPNATPTQPDATPTLEETPTNVPEAQVIIPDLEAVPEGAVWNGTIHNAAIVEKDGAAAIEFTQLDWNLVWLDGFEFVDGTIEFDAKGKSEPLQESFIGVAFRLEDDGTYDAVYFRPFNFRSPDDVRKSHAVQYVSFPEWNWDRLRAEKPGEYEMPIEPAPDGDMWFHVKILLEGQQISVFVNDAQEPALQVTALNDRSGGSVGIWCYGYGVISNLQIIPVE